MTDLATENLMKKSAYDQEHTEVRLGYIREFINRTSKHNLWAHDFAERKLREFSSGEDNKPENDDISELISYG